MEDSTDSSLYETVNEICAGFTHAYNPEKSLQCNIDEHLIHHLESLVTRIDILHILDVKKPPTTTMIQTLCSNFIASYRPSFTHDQNVNQSLKPMILAFLQTLRQQQIQHSRLQKEKSFTKSNSSAPPLPSALPNLETERFAMDQAEAAGFVQETATSGEIHIEGWLRKKGQHINIWRERYFMIRASADRSYYLLCYFRKKGDKEPRGFYMLSPFCTVDEIRESPSKIETKRLFTFRIRNYESLKEDLDPSLIEGDEPFTPQRSGLSVSSSQSTDDALNMSSTRSIMHESNLPYSTPASMDRYETFPSSTRHRVSSADDFDTRGAIKKHQSRKRAKRAAAAGIAATAATAFVLTGGLAGLGFGAAAASAGVGALFAQSKGKPGPLALAAESKETAEWWRENILECIAQAEENWRRFVDAQSTAHHAALLESERKLASAVNSDEDRCTNRDESGPKDSKKGKRDGTLSSVSLPKNSSRSSKQQNKPVKRASLRRSGSYGTVPRSFAKTFRNNVAWSEHANWRQLLEYQHTQRVYEEISPLSSYSIPTYKSSVRIRTSPATAFRMIMALNSPFYEFNHVLLHASVVTRIDSHSDVVHLVLNLGSHWGLTAAIRDVCLLRYWRKEEDGSYVVCYHSTQHQDCPPMSSIILPSSKDPVPVVRANMIGSAFIIAPRLDQDPSDELSEGGKEDDIQECLVTKTCQLDPRGWLSLIFFRGEIVRMNARFLEQLCCLKEEVQNLQYNGLSLRAATGNAPNSSHKVESKFPLGSEFDTVVNELPVSLPKKVWSEPLVALPRMQLRKEILDQSRPKFSIVGADLFRLYGDIESKYVANREGLLVRVLSRLSATSTPKPFTIVLNLFTSQYSMVLYFTHPEPKSFGEKDEIFMKLYESLIARYRSSMNDKHMHDAGYGTLSNAEHYSASSSEEDCNVKLRLHPIVLEGCWMIQQLIGNKPIVLGKDVDMNITADSTSLEIDVDLQTSGTSAGLASLVGAHLPSLAIEIALVVEGIENGEVHDRLLACARLCQVDESYAIPF